MEILITGAGAEQLEGLAEWESGQDPARSLGACLGELTAELSRRQWIIVGQSLDGEALPAERLRELAGESLEAFGTLEVEIADLRSFLEATFGECFNSVSKLKELQVEISRQTEEGQISEAVQPLREFSEGLRIVLKAFRDGITLLAQSAGATEESLAPIDERLRQIELVLGDVVSGIENRDPVPVSDAFEYEFPDHLQWLEESLETWRESLASPVGDAGA